MPHKNSIRQRIVNENLLAYKEFVPSSDRNINIVEELVTGSSYVEIGKKYQISSQRVRQIVLNYIRYCVWYLKHCDND